MKSSKRISCVNCGQQAASKFYFYTEKNGRQRHRCKLCSCKSAKNYSDEHKAANLARHRKRREEQKLEVFQYYSGSEKPYCACCKEDVIEFLVLDHKDGGGNAHREKVGANMVWFARSNNYPPIFRVLCWNCNSCMGMYGHCVHERPRGSRPPI